MVVSIAILLAVPQIAEMQTVWHRPFSLDSDYAVAINDSTTFALGPNGTLTAIDTSTGAVRKAISLGSKRTTAIATEGNEWVYVVNGENLQKLNSVGLTTKWVSPDKIDMPQLGCAVTAGGDGTVAVKRVRGMSFFSAEDGKSISKQWTAGMGSPVTAPLYTKRGVAFMSGALALFNQKEEKSIWVAKVGQSGHIQPPAFDGQSFYIATHDGLSKIDEATGKILWNVKNCSLGVALCGDVVVSGSGPGPSGFSKETGERLWTIPKLQAFALVRLSDDKVGILYNKNNYIRVGVFSTSDGTQLQESRIIANRHIDGHPELYLTKQGTVVGQYWSTVFCLGSGVQTEVL